jgi:arylsulfatase A-like enzyme
LLVAAASYGCAPKPSPWTRPNVLLVTFDTMRADFLGCYGNRLTRTPTLDRLASRGIVFDWAFTADPFTPPALWSLLYSEHVQGHTYGMSIKDHFGAAGSIAERFQKAGYDTVAVVGSSQLIRGLGYERGFARFLDTYAEPSLTNETTLARALELAERRLDPQQGRRPYFLYVHFFDPHTPWGNAPPPFRTYPAEPSPFAEAARRGGNFRGNQEMIAAIRTYSGREDVEQLQQTGRYEELITPMYRSEISWSDDVLRRLIETFDRRGLLANTVLAVSSDHGIAFAEHYQLSGYVFSLFPESLHVPLILSGPGLKPARVSAPVSLIDLGPTLLDLAGIGSQHADGASLLPLVRGIAKPRGVHGAATAMPPDLQSVISRDDRSRYGTGVANRHTTLIQDGVQIIHMPARRGAKFELFDLTRDPGEFHDVYSPTDPVHRRMAEDLLGWEAGKEDPPVLLDPEARERLRALGYTH